MNSYPYIATSSVIGGLWGGEGHSQKAAVRSISFGLSLRTIRSTYIKPGKVPLTPPTPSTQTLATCGVETAKGIRHYWSGKKEGAFHVSRSPDRSCERTHVCLPPVHLHAMRTPPSLTLSYCLPLRARATSARFSLKMSAAAASTWKTCY